MSQETPPGGRPKCCALAVGLLHALVLLPVPALALLLLAPDGPTLTTSVRANAPPAGYGDQGPFLVSDVRDLCRLEKTLHRVQLAAPPMPTDLGPGEGGVADLLNGWEQVGRTARRHKSSLDYFLGFGF